VKRSVLGILLVLTFVAVSIAAAPPLTFKFTSPKAKPSALETDTYAVNNAQQIAGDYIDKNGVQHGMILHGKALTTFDSKKCAGGGIAAYGINKKGAVAGWCSDANGVNIGFTWAAGKLTNVNFPKGTGTQVTGINDAGSVAGLYFDSAGLQHGFYKIGKRYTQIKDVKNATTTAAWGINNQNLITIEAVDATSGLFDAYIYNPKTKKLKKVNVPKSTNSIIHTMNNKGDITYTYDTSDGVRHGGLFHAGAFYAVDFPAATSTRNDGINDTLVMVGRYSPSDGSNHGFKAVTKQ